LGARQLGEAEVPEDECARLLNLALDRGVTLIDAARGYDLSEERIGRHLGSRRHEVVISTKVGYAVPGNEDWSPAAVTLGIEKSLRRLATDCIDIVHLHSCPLEVLQDGAAVEALERARTAGKVRFIGYSGENEALSYAVSCGRFDVIEVSINLFDQRCIDTTVAAAAANGIGVLAKRSTGNAPWRFPLRPTGWYVEPYWERMQMMDLDPSPMSWRELALRFALTVSGVTSVIVGTGSAVHLIENLSAAAQGPLPQRIFDQCRQAFAAHDLDWVGQV